MPNSQNTDKFTLQNIEISVTYKDIKNIHLSVYPPNGEVVISAPLRMRKDIVRVYTISKLSWIKKQREKLQKQEREPKREFLDKESHYLFGKRYLLKVVETKSKPSIQVKSSSIILSIPKRTSKPKVKKLFDDYYKSELQLKTEKIMASAQKKMGLSNITFGIRKMKTRWGSYIPGKKKVWLNTELAKKPIDCIEYIIYHELTHAFEKTHNVKFKSILSHHLPNWKELRKKLNQLPTAHVDWEY
ncbi:M48 family metallopeptidase [Leptospira sp. 2 VSF19]|uniref:M48 family metallopeptidase n=1 Tax=Leptospira soteropolitanensis TaxID=2950025 RepID=A0AAW5VG10_9LEPT|nr:SprT family zinc-dependent metalloprotease [Leptospira soteropolitanensis]MCW7491981.1 M48 family metallopeptidase [Leptospira soteropolitanensis]MCW7499564.1 M48 family metallopeptidase [Leptospira soteropolitanensis]MCW7521815.1 M48 family metallopeptidase [Leptospira soteropolitanensis]MCW7525668.1 M48 family metallopeptidase [Leptospira soteropolitanensis]MCW7530217.1 M48 family metallopeptidase [Leptospira soteropolitanensis]